MHHGDPIRGDAFFDKVLFDGFRTGNEAALPTVPECRREAVDVANRRRTAHLFEPAAPPACAGEMRVKYIGTETAGRGSQSRRREQITFAADADAVERHICLDHLDVGFTGTRNTMVYHLLARGASQQPSQEGFGPGHSRRSDRMKHAGRSRARGDDRGRRGSASC
jgi:hypothetical protein